MVLDLGSTAQQVEKAKEAYSKRLASVSDVAMDTFKTLILRARPLPVQDSTIAVLFEWCVVCKSCALLNLLPYLPRVCAFGYARVTLSFFALLSPSRSLALPRISFTCAGSPMPPMNHQIISAMAVTLIM